MIVELLPNAEEESIVEAVSQYLESALPVSRLHGPDAGAWNATIRSNIADLGWYGLGLSDDLGGSGFTAVEEALLFREFGRYLGPIEVLPIVLAAHLSAAADCSDLARALISGKHTVALAFLDYSAAEQPGLRCFGARDASYLVHVTRDRAALFDLRSVSFSPRPCLDKSTSAAVTVQLFDPIASIHGSGLFLRAQLTTAAMLLGVAEAVTAMIVAYAKQRITFGKAIGSYQAVRHPCAEMALRCEAARQQLFAAAVSLRDLRNDADLQVSSVKLIANQAARSNVDVNTQLHGGIGITKEHDGHLFLKRAHLLLPWFGEDRELLDHIHALSLASASGPKG